MKVTETTLPGVLILEPRMFRDARGFFLESYNEKAMAEAGIRERFVQDNHSFSTRDVVRGLHYQVRPQGKLVRVAVGEILDVAVDLRRGSPTLGRWCGMNLSEAKAADAMDSSGIRSRIPCLVGEVLTCSTRPPISMIPRRSARLPGTIRIEDRLAACRSTRTLRQGSSGGCFSRGRAFRLGSAVITKLFQGDGHDEFAQKFSPLHGGWRGRGGGRTLVGGRNPATHVSDTGRAGRSGRLIHLDNNENPYGPSAKVAEAIRSATGMVNRYPSRKYGEVTERIAHFHRVKPENVLFACGSTEILRVAACSFAGSGRQLIQAVPTFEAVEEYAKAVGSEVVSVPLDPTYAHDLGAMLARTNASTGLIYICNPNNPTSSLTPRKAIEDFVGRLPASTRVVDR